MAIKTVSVDVAKETYELAAGVAQFLSALKEAVSDGWDTGDDLPIMLESAIKHLFPAMEGITGIGDEFKADPAAVYKAVSVGLVDVIMASISEG